MSANPFAGNFSEGNKMYFRVSKLDVDKNGNPKSYILYGKKEDQKKFDYIEGYLVNIESFSETFEGNKIEKIRFTFRPKEGEFLAVLSCGRYTAFTRDVLNCLVNIAGIEYVRMTPFVSEDATTKKTYIHGSVKNNGTKITKKFPYDMVPKIKEEYVPQVKKNILITGERDEFFDNLIPQILEKLAYSEKVAIENGVDENEDTLTDDEEINIPVTDDGLPY